MEAKHSPSARFRKHSSNVQLSLRMSFVRACARPSVKRMQMSPHEHISFFIHHFFASSEICPKQMTLGRHLQRSFPYQHVCLQRLCIRSKLTKGYITAIKPINPSYMTILLLYLFLVDILFICRVL